MSFAKKENTDFVGARKTFKDKTKTGGDKYTLYLGEQDVAALIQKLQQFASNDGVKMSVFITEGEKGTRGSILIDASKGKGAPGTGGPTKFAPKKTFGGPIAFKPKTVIGA